MQAFRVTVPSICHTPDGLPSLHLNSRSERASGLRGRLDRPGRLDRLDRHNSVVVNPNRQHVPIGNLANKRNHSSDGSLHAISRGRGEINAAMPRAVRCGRLPEVLGDLQRRAERRLPDLGLESGGTRQHHNEENSEDHPLSLQRRGPGCGKRLAHCGKQQGADPIGLPVRNA